MPPLDIKWSACKISSVAGHTAGKQARVHRKPIMTVILMPLPSYLNTLSQREAEYLEMFAYDLTFAGSTERNLIDSIYLFYIKILRQMVRTSEI